MLKNYNKFAIITPSITLPNSYHTWTRNTIPINVSFPPKRIIVTFRNLGYGGSRVEGFADSMMHMSKQNASQCGTMRAFLTSISNRDMDFNYYTELRENIGELTILVIG